MKRTRKLLGGISLCLTAVFLCGLLMVSAFAVGPNEVQLTLTWTGVDASANDGAVNGQVVTAGNLTFYEDGILKEINGKNLIPIDSSGTTTISYPFDPNKTYTITVEEKLAAPYYKTKDIVLTPAQVNTAITSGQAINETVEWVEWSKPIKVSLVDSTGAPQSIPNVSVSLADIDNLNLQFTYENDRKTNVAGVATFPSHSFDPDDRTMCNILNDQVLVSAQCPAVSGGTPTTIARLVQLYNTNVVELTYPEAIVSGTVYKADGTPAANTRVAAYYYLPALNDELAASPWNLPFDFPEHLLENMKDFLNLCFYVDVTVYYTTTDANGNYTLALPYGPVEICAGDSPRVNRYGMYDNEYNRDSASGRYYAAAISHFPWLSVVNSDQGTYPFEGIFCQEVTPLVLNVTADMNGQNLALGSAAAGYTLKANITVNGQPCTPDMDDMALLFVTRGSSTVTPPSGVHASAGYTDNTYELDVRGAIPNGIDRGGVKLAPGEYWVDFTCRSADFVLKYANVLPCAVNIPLSAINTGTVDLGTLDFTAIPRQVGGVNAMTPQEILSQYTPIPAPQPYGYLSTRIEAVPDPAYGPFAYQFTIHYCGHHTGANATTMSGGKLEVSIPTGVTVRDPGSMTLSGGKLKQNLPTLTLGQIYSTTFTADVEATSGDSTFELSSAPNYGGINAGSDDVLKVSSSITVNRPRITLNAPRTVGVGEKFLVFGNATGTDGSGILLLNRGTSNDIATGALKGRYYYFKAGGLDQGTYTLAAHTQRHGTEEFSQDITLEAKAGSLKVDDAYIMSNGKKIAINANFGMVYCTAFVRSDDRYVSPFDLYFKFNQAPASGEAVTIDIGGVTFPAAPDAANPGYYKASINSLYASGEQAVLLKVGSGFTTQIACLMLML